MGLRFFADPLTRFHRIFRLSASKRFHGFYLNRVYSSFLKKQIKNPFIGISGINSQFITYVVAGIYLAVLVYRTRERFCIYIWLQSNILPRLFFRSATLIELCVPRISYIQCYSKSRSIISVLCKNQ